jgi:hypothetical protein
MNILKFNSTQELYDRKLQQYCSPNKGWQKQYKKSKWLFKLSFFFVVTSAIAMMAGIVYMTKGSTDGVIKMFLSFGYGFVSLILYKACYYGSCRIEREANDKYGIPVNGIVKPDLMIEGDVLTIVFWNKDTLKYDNENHYVTPQNLSSIYKINKKGIKTIEFQEDLDEEIACTVKGTGTIIDNRSINGTAAECHEMMFLLCSEQEGEADAIRKWGGIDDR